MAVEARHIYPFPSQLSNRNPIMMNNNQEAAFTRPYSYIVSQSSSQQVHHFSSNKTDMNTQNSLHQFFQSQRPGNKQMMLCDSVHAKTEGGLTFNNIIPISRKRSRDTTNVAGTYNQEFTDIIHRNLTSARQPLYGDFLPQMLQQHQYEVEALVSQHTKKMRLELAEKQRQHARSLLSSISEAMLKKLREKDEQIARMGKTNQALQERVKSLYAENQLWRDLAQTNEATANSLRTNLEQVLLHVSSEEQAHVSDNDVDDVESCCGSSGDVDDDSHRWCKICCERESCVLLLPCRHLCLCGVCGQTVKACPTCHSSMNATVHVNLSSS